MKTAVASATRLLVFLTSAVIVAPSMAATGSVPTRYPSTQTAADGASPSERIRPSVRLVPAKPLPPSSADQIGKTAVPSPAAELQGVGALDPGVFEQPVTEPLEILEPSPPKEPEITRESALRVAMARAAWDWGPTATPGSVVPLYDLDGLVCAYDVDFTLDGSPFGSYVEVAADLLRSRLQRVEAEVAPPNAFNQPLPRDGSPASKYASVTVSATYDAPPILRSSRSVSSFYQTGWLAREAARKALRTERPILRRVLCDGFRERLYEFTDGTSTILVQGYPPWGWYPADTYRIAAKQKLERRMEEVSLALAARSRTFAAAQDSTRKANAAALTRWLDGAISERVQKEIPGWNNPSQFAVYEWFGGCTPTAAAMVLNYYDGGFRDPYYGYLTSYYARLVDPCDGRTKCHVPDMIPFLRSTMGTLCPDGYTNPANTYGGMIAYTNDVCGYAFSGGINLSGGPGNWRETEGRAEIDGGYPFVWTVANYPGHGPHSVAVVAYRNISGTTEWGCYTTWHDPSPVFEWQAVSGTLYVTVWLISPHPCCYTNSNALLTFPDGDQTYAVCSTSDLLLGGQTTNITWDRLGSPSDAVDLELSTDSGQTWDWIDWNVPDVGSYTWTVPCIDSYRCRIRITQYIGSNVQSQDGSYGDFRIYPGPPSCSVSPRDLTFNVGSIGGSDPKTFTITNTGCGTLSGTISESCVDFSVSPSSYALGPNQHQEFTVIYNPQDCGNDNCTINTGGTCASVHCTGTGPSTPSCSVSPISLSFNVSTIGGSDPKTFTITNTGCGTLSGTVSESCADFSVSPGSYALGPNQHQDVTVVYNPQDCGNDNCTISTGGSCTSVNCIGTGPARPGRPSSVNASNNLCNRICVSWTDVSGETGYRIYRDNQNNAVGTAAANATQWCENIAGTHQYWVSAFNVCGESSQAGPVAGTGIANPDAPTWCAATDGTYCDRVVVTWPDVAGESGYRLYRDGSQLGADLPAGTTSAVDVTAVPGQPYEYWVRAFNACGPSGDSQHDSGYRRPAPASPSVCAATDGFYCDKVVVTWSDVSGEDGYRVYRDGVQVGGDLPAGTSSWDDFSAVPGQTYQYWVCAFTACSSGDSPHDSGYRGSAPAAPSWCEASDYYPCDKVVVTWPDVSAATGYRVYRDGVPLSGDLPAGTLRWDDVSAVPWQDYQYWVCAFNVCGSSAESPHDAGVRAQAVVRMLVPNGSESYAEGNLLQVSWYVENVCTPYIDLQLSRSGSSGPWELIASHVRSDDVYDWIVTGPASSNCYMRIADSDNGQLYDVSDGPFAITNTVGACCAAFQTCVVMTEAQCNAAGGMFLPDHDSCEPNPCPPFCACCHGTYCSFDSPGGCYNSGGFCSDAYTCDPNPCPPPTGACCFPNGHCTVLTEADCQAQSGTWQGMGTVCSPNPCQQPTGACCLHDGTCSLTLQANCTGTWTIDGTCTPNPCTQPTGSCCLHDGSCSVTLQASCTGTWTIDGTCTPNPCIPSGIAAIEVTVGEGFLGGVPNPFTASATFWYRLSEKGYVLLEICDVGGHKIRSLDMGEMEPGVHSIGWDGQSSQGNPVRSGVFFARLSTNGHTWTRALIRVK